MLFFVGKGGGSNDGQDLFSSLAGGNFQCATQRHLYVGLDAHVFDPTEP